MESKCIVTFPNLIAAQKYCGTLAIVGKLWQVAIVTSEIMKCELKYIKSTLAYLLINSTRVNVLRSYIAFRIPSLPSAISPFMR